MAADTQNKRTSAINLGLPWRGFLPIPDGVVESPDRTQVLFLYWSNLSSAPVPVVPPPPAHSFNPTLPAPRAFDPPGSLSLNGTGIKVSMPLALMRDRADVIRREVEPVNGEIVGVAESVIARGVPCIVQSVRTSGLASLLGKQSVALFSIHVGRDPEIHPGYVMLVRGVRYAVTVASRYPSPHRFDFQVLDAVLEVSESRA